MDNKSEQVSLYHVVIVPQTNNVLR